MNLDNCPRCGKLFAKNFRDVCPACMREIDNEYQRCADYLRENKGAIISELSEATKVSIKQITKFIREGRISMMNAPNMSYPCESCGALIRESHICDECRARLVKETQKMQRNDLRNADDKERSEPAAKGAYKGLGQYKNR